MLLSFSANTVDPLILEKTLIGRKEVVDRVEQELLEKILKTQTYQSLLIAPRGSGKTHITKVLHYRLKSNQTLDDRILVAYMNEDERGIANFSDFIRHILLSFIKHQEGQYENLNDLIYQVADLEIDKQEEAFIQILLQFISKKGLVVLIENLNVLFDKKTGMGLDGQSKLRSLMHEHNQFSILATSQNLFYQIQDAKAPFYNFFNIEHLQKLDFATAFEFIKVQANLTQDEHLEQGISTPIFKGKVKAIYQLTGGNHRLLVMFFNFLKIDLKSDLSKVFVKTMNDLKPYYEQFLNALSPQQQKIIQFLGSKHTPQMGKDIARFCFIATNTLSKQTSELVEKGYLDKSKIGKDTYYELKEPLMRICFEITDNASGAAKLFIDFLSVLYSIEDLQKKYLKFKFGAQLQDIDKKAMYETEALFYKQSLPNKIIETLDGITMPNFKNEEELDEHIDDVLKDEQIIEEIKKILGADLLSKIIDNFKAAKKPPLLNPDFYEQLVKETTFSKESALYHAYGKLLIHKEKFEQSIKILDTAISINPKDENIFFDKGTAHSRLNQHEKAVQAFKTAIDINASFEEAYYNCGLAFYELKDYKKGISCFTKVIELDSTNAMAYGLCGLTHSYLKQYEKAIEFFTIAEELGLRDESIYYEHGKIYINLGELEKAKEIFNKAIELNTKDENVYYVAGMVYSLLNEYENAIDCLSTAISIAPNNLYYYNWLGLIYFENNQYEKAEKSIKDGLLLDENSWDLNGRLMHLYLSTSNLEKSKNQFKNMYALAIKEEYSFSAFLEEANLLPLFESTNLQIAKSYIQFLLAILEDKLLLPELWKAFPKAIFTVLINIEEHSAERLDELNNYLKEIFKAYKEMTIPLLYFDTGIRYLKKGDKRAIYGLSKEERQVFKEFVLDKREVSAE